MARMKIWIGDATAERTIQTAPFRSKTAPEFVVTDQRRAFFRPVWITAPNYSTAHRAIEIMANDFFPAKDGYEKQGVSGLMELSANDVLGTLVGSGAVTASDLKAILKRMENYG